MLKTRGPLIAIVLMLLQVSSGWAQAVSREQIKGLDEQVQEAKSDVLNITAELQRLEEKLLFPSNTQLSLFVALEKGEDFQLDAVQIDLDGEPVAYHIYSFKELEALQKGGVQRIHTGNIRTGEHQLRVSLMGKSASGRDYQKSSTFTVTKDVGPKLLGIILAGPGKGDDSIAVENW